MPEDDKPLNLLSSVNNQSVPSNQKDVLSNKDIIDKKVLLKNYIYIYIQWWEGYFGNVLGYRLQVLPNLNVSYDTGFEINSLHRYDGKHWHLTAPWKNCTS